MKMIVKLAVLLATLLLLSGVSFANNCDLYCYAVIATEIEDPTNQLSECTEVQICGDNTGDVNSWFFDSIVLFFDPLNKKALAYYSASPDCLGYFKFHGDDLHVVNGISFCDTFGGLRWNIRGHRVDCCSADCPC